MDLFSRDWVLHKFGVGFKFSNQATDLRVLWLGGSELILSVSFEGTGTGGGL